MTNRITLAASEVRVNDHIYNGTCTNAIPPTLGETMTVGLVSMVIYVFLV